LEAVLPTKASGYRSIAIRRPQPSGGAGFARDHLKRAASTLGLALEPAIKLIGAYRYPRAAPRSETYVFGLRLPLLFRQSLPKEVRSSPAGDCLRRASRRQPYANYQTQQLEQVHAKLLQKAELRDNTLDQIFGQ
jgi:hypothetical protein